VSEKRSGENRRELDARKGKEGEGSGGKREGNEGGETRGGACIESWKEMVRARTGSGDGEKGSNPQEVGK
jgi:hypothetical protein